MPLGLQANASDSCLHFIPSSTNPPGMRKCSQSKGRASAEFTRELSSQTKSKNPISCVIQESFQNAPRKMSFHPHLGNPKSIPGGRDE